MEVSLAGGEDGFDTGAEVIRLAFPEIHAGVTVDRAEATWIRACWLAMGALRNPSPSTDGDPAAE